MDVNVKGAFTGDISTEMLKDFGAKYIIIGHSERRTYHKESDEFVAKKIRCVKRSRLSAGIMYRGIRSGKRSG